MGKYTDSIDIITIAAFLIIGPFLGAVGILEVIYPEFISSHVAIGVTTAALGLALIFESIRRVDRWRDSVRSSAKNK